MKPGKSTFFLAFLLLLLCQVIKAQEKFSTVKIFPPADRMQRSELIGLLEIDHYQPLSDGAILAEIGERELQKLKSTPYRHEVLVADVAARLHELNKKYYDDKATGISPDQNRLAFEQTGSVVNSIIPTPSAFEVKSTYGGYYQYSEIVAAIDALVAAYPTIASKQALAPLTHNGNTIWVVKISDNVGTDESNEPEVLLLGLQHAREAIGGSSMIFLMQYLCENYATDPRIQDLVNNREIYIVPCLNPDGWIYNYTLNNNGGGGWRKNRRNNGGGNFGVDLNRNWGVDWANCSAPIQGSAASCGSGSGSSDTYYGPSVFSEPETQAIRDFTYTRNFVAMIDQHSFGPYYSLPFGRPSLHSFATDPVVNTLDSMYYVRISSAMGTYNGMRSGNSYEALDYEVAGGVKDWMLKGNIGTGSKGKVYGMTGEGGAGGGTGGAYGSFWPPASQIINLCKGMVFQNLQLIYSAGSYVGLQDATDINLGSLSGNFNFTATRIGLDNQQVYVSIIPMENISSVGTISPFNLVNYGDIYNGSISYTLPAALTAGQRVKFAWKIETGGVTYYDTVIKFYSAQQLLYDNMDGSLATNWTSSTWGLTSAGTGYGGGSSRSMSESASGNYPASSTRTVTYNSTFNLSDATAAYLNFWVRHRAENFHDKLQVQVSPDGSTWTAIAGSTTIQEPGTLDGSTINGQPALTGVKVDWTREMFSLNNYLSAGALRLRFVFTADATNSFAFSEDDGFYIDELKVIKSTAILITLPVNFINFTAKLTQENSVKLNWQAEVDGKHSHFVVERSTDGQNFIAIGRVNATPYSLTDNSPAIGNNYYRIKQYDIDGKFAYSKTVHVYYDPSSFTMMMYPNPVNEEVSFRFNSERPENVIIRITDLAGKTVYSKQVTAGGNSNEVKINVQGWTSQIYIVKAIKQDNTILSVQKLIKQ